MLYHPSEKPLVVVEVSAEVYLQLAIMLHLLLMWKVLKTCPGLAAMPHLVDILKIH